MDVGQRFLPSRFVLLVRGFDLGREFSARTGDAN